MTEIKDSTFTFMRLVAAYLMNGLRSVSGMMSGVSVAVISLLLFHVLACSTVTTVDQSGGNKLILEG